METKAAQCVRVERPCVIRKGTEFCNGMTRDIGRWGALVALRATFVDHKFLYGEEIEMEIQLDTNPMFAPKCIHCRGAVVRVEWTGPGVVEIAVQFAKVAFRNAKYTGTVAVPGRVM